MTTVGRMQFMIWMIAMIVVNELDTSGYVCGSHLSATLANISITVCENFIQVARS